MLTNQTNPAKVDQAVECLKALAHPIRLGILCSLADGERSVQQLETMLAGFSSNLSQSTLSQHLATMRTRGIVAARREANQVFYSVRDPRMFELIRILQQIYCPESIETVAFEKDE